MRLPKFDYREPKSVEEAVTLMSGNTGDTCIVSGGTELYVHLKQRLVTPKNIISLMKIPDMAFINYNEETGLTIGPCVTQAILERWALGHRSY